MEMKRLLIIAMPLLVLSSACGSTPSPMTPTPTPSPIASTPPLLPSPNVTLAVSLANLRRNQATTFELTVSGSALSSSVLDFGDGTPLFTHGLAVDAQSSFTAFAAEVEHVYGAVGTFTATLQVTDTAGKTASVSTTLVVSDQ